MASWFKIIYNHNKAKVAHCNHPIESSARWVQWNHSIYPHCYQHIPSRLALSRWFSGVHRSCRILISSLIVYSSISLSSSIFKLPTLQPPTNHYFQCVSPFLRHQLRLLPAVMFRVTTGLSLPLMNEPAVLAWSRRCNEKKKWHHFFLGGGKQTSIKGDGYPFETPSKLGEVFVIRPT